MVPAHEAEVVDGRREFEVRQQAIRSSEVYAHSESGKTETVIVYFAPVYEIFHSGFLYFRSAFKARGHIKAFTGCHVHVAVGLYYPFVATETYVHVINMRIGAACTEQHFEFSAHREFLIDLALMP